MTPFRQASEWRTHKTRFAFASISAAVLLSLMLAPSARCDEGDGLTEPKTKARDHSRRGGNGIWKAIVPPEGSTPGEYEGHDPTGLITGATIQTDCSINWIDPNTRKRYCFTTSTSIAYFVSWPASNIRKANKVWAQIVSKRNQKTH